MFICCLYALLTGVRIDLHINCPKQKIIYLKEYISNIDKMKPSPLNLFNLY